MREGEIFDLKMRDNEQNKRVIQKENSNENNNKTIKNEKFERFLNL
jgi:hypothetical protein